MRRVWREWVSLCLEGRGGHRRWIASNTVGMGGNIEKEGVYEPK
jgi:hypothetical protein